MMFVEGGGQFGQLHQMRHKNLKTMLLYTGLYNWVSSKFCACACTKSVSPCTQTSNSIMCFGRAPGKEQVVEAEETVCSHTLLSEIWKFSLQKHTQIEVQCIVVGGNRATK